jgi:hypothetical protein
MILDAGIVGNKFRKKYDKVFMENKEFQKKLGTRGPTTCKRAQVA